MSDKHNIDQLFNDKLSGREVDYTPSSWTGAEALLDGHFRWLWWKKALMFITPIVAITAVSLTFLFNDSVQTEQSEESVVTAGVESSVGSSEIIDNAISASSEDIELTTVVANTQEPAATEKAEAVSGVKRPDLDDAKISVPPTKIATNEYPEPNAEQPKAAIAAQAIEATEAASEEAYTDEYAALETNFTGSLETDSELDNLELMPSFTLNGLGLHSNFNIVDRDAMDKEALMSMARKFDLSAHIGGVLATGMQNIQATSEFIAFGGYIGIIARYYFNQRIYGEFGAILNARNALGADNSLLASGSRTVRVQNVTYCDIPIVVGYRFGARHSATFGMAFSPLAFVQTTDAGIASETLDLKYGAPARDGFADFDVAGLLGYSFQATNRIDLHAQVRYGLFDITDNQFWQTQIVDDRNHQLRVGLSYRLINR